MEIVSNRKKIPYFTDSFDVDANQIFEGVERCVNSANLPDFAGVRLHDYLARII